MSRTILVVDDDPDILEIAELALSIRADWRIVTASSGSEAVESAATLRPDVVLCDVMMPTMDGPATLKALRNQEATRHVPVVFLTAKARDSDRQSLLAIGAAAVFNKPFDVFTLADELSAQMGWAS